MKAISLWQPWATLWLLSDPDEKRFETRDWYCAYRGELLVHAAKKRDGEVRIALGMSCAEWMLDAGLSGTQIEAVAASKFWRGLKNVNIGCSVMNQSEADKYREPMRAIAALGWNTHVWYEPAIGAVNWAGWEFLRGMISGGESGANSRPSDPAWHRDTRDWCIANGIPYNFKQWGDWCDWDNLPDATYYELDAAGLPPAESVVCVGKKRAGRLLDGRTWDGLPAFR